MSRFRKLSHTIWHCHYHVIGVAKYRLRILSGPVGEQVSRGLRTFAEPKGGEVIELNVQVEHVDLVVMIAPKRSIWELVGLLQGKTAIRVFNRFRHRKPKP